MKILISLWQFDQIIFEGINIAPFQFQLEYFIKKFVMCISS